MPDDELPFKVVRTNSHDEVIALAANLLVGEPPMKQPGGCIRRIGLIIGVGQE